MDKQKARGLLKLKINGIFSPFRVYGLDIYIPGAIAEIIRAIDEYEERIGVKEAHGK